MSQPDPSFDLRRGSSKETREATRELTREIEELRKDNNRLLLITEALWRIVKERLECTDADLVNRIHDIDLEDGYLDGHKAPSPPRPCPHCGKILSKHKPRCIYCGKAVEFLPFER
jgi:ribosomal protein S27AE